MRIYTSFTVSETVAESRIVIAGSVVLAPTSEAIFVGEADERERFGSL